MIYPDSSSLVSGAGQLVASTAKSSGCGRERSLGCIILSDACRPWRWKAICARVRWISVELNRLVPTDALGSLT